MVNDHPERQYEKISALPFKYVSLNESGSNYVSFGGEFRMTYESYDPRDRGLTDVGRSDVLMNRLAAHADWHPNERWRIFGQLGHAASGDREGGAKPGDESDLNVWQAFVDRRFDLDNGDRLDFRLGRQFIEKGNWFIGAGEAPNVRQYYDGIRMAWLDSRYAKFDAFAMEYVDTTTGSFEMRGSGEYFWGATAGFRLDSPDINLSAMYFGWDLQDLQFQQTDAGFHNERRHTVIAWINKPVNPENHWSYDYYLAYQFGTYEDAQDSDIQAYSAFGEIKYALRDQVRTPVIGLRTSYFSGDSDPTDGKLETFYNPVFVTVYFTYARDIQPFNLLHIQPNIGYRFSEELSITLSADFLRLQ